MKHCSIEECEKQSYAKTYCEKHYKRHYKYGDARTVKKLYRQNGQCKIAGCGRKINSKSMCDKHYKRTKNTKTRISWIAMRQRCNYPDSTVYSYYGGRGIKVCKRWDDFDLFLEDMGERPAGTTLDRIDVNGDYEPSNCRWSTAEEQARNRRVYVNSMDGVSGVHKRENGKYRVYISINNKRINLGTYEDIEEAISIRLMAESIYWS